MARPRRSTSRSKPSTSGRAKVVWVSLMGAMTAVGGALLLLDRPAPRADGHTMPALAATVHDDGAVLQTNKPLDAARWKAIVIHHSDSPAGTMATIAKQHAGLGFKGIGHHIVIGNGRGMNDGEVQFTYRWMDQLPGAHAAGKDAKFYNNHAISICLVGDGDRERFTRAQMQRLGELVATLRERFGIPADKVFLHAQLAPTSDPGTLFPATQFRASLRNNP